MRVGVRLGTASSTGCGETRGSRLGWMLGRSAANGVAAGDNMTSEVAAGDNMTSEVAAGERGGAGACAACGVARGHARRGRAGVARGRRGSGEAGLGDSKGAEGACGEWRSSVRGSRSSGTVWRAPGATGMARRFSRHSSPKLSLG